MYEISHKGMVASHALPEMFAFFCVLTGYKFTLSFQDSRYVALTQKFSGKWYKF